MSSNGINIEKAERLMKSSRGLLIDVRDSLSYRCGRLPKAINVSLDRLSLLLNNVNKKLPVILYCEYGDLSEDSCSLFSDFGFEQCYYLFGGYSEWVESQNINAHPNKGLCNWLAENGYSCDDIERRGFNNETALIFAARQGKTEYLVDLVDRGADLDALNNDGNSALWLACYANNKHSLAELIRAGADLNTQNQNGATTLIYAASAKREEMVNMLLKAGADHNLVTLDDFSALDVASTPTILKLLRNAQDRDQQLAG